MSAPYLGGFKITKAGWQSSQAIVVDFSSTYGSDYAYQLYAGRTLIGVTRSNTDRSIIGDLEPSLWPQQLTLLAVEAANKLVDYGASLPKRAFNRARFRFSTSSWPADSKTIELAAGTIVGGAVDITNIVERIFFDVDREFEILSPPMPGSGQWNFEIAGRDNRPPEGNRGTALAVNADLLAHPPDVELQDDNTRFTVSIDAGVATISFTNPS